MWEINDFFGDQISCEKVLTCDIAIADVQQAGSHNQKHIAALYLLSTDTKNSSCSPVNLPYTYYCIYILIPSTFNNFLSPPTSLLLVYRVCPIHIPISTAEPLTICFSVNLRLP